MLRETASLTAREADKNSKGQRVHKSRDTKSKGEQRPNARACPGHSPGPVRLSHSWGNGPLASRFVSHPHPGRKPRRVPRDRPIFGGRTQEGQLFPATVGGLRATCCYSSDRLLPLTARGR